MTGAFLAQARLGRGGRLHYVVGVVLILVAWFVLGAASYVVLLNLPLALDPWTRGYVELNFPFLPLIPVIALVVVAWHRRPLASLVTAFARIDPGRMALAFVAAGVLFVSMSWLAGDDAAQAGSRAGLLLALPAILILTPIQAAGEELLFRGYVLQATAAFTSSKAIVVLVNAALFAGLHAFNPAAQASPLLAIVGYGLSGAGLAWVAVRDDGLELPIGAHVANNLVSFSIAAYLQMPFEREGDDYDALLHYVGSLAPVALLLLIAHLRPRRAG
jgi:hypothetical protein